MLRARLPFWTAFVTTASDAVVNGVVGVPAEPLAEVGVTAGVVLVTMPVFVELSLGVAAEEELGVVSTGVPVPVPVLGVSDAELVSTMMLDDEEGVSKLRLEGVIEPELPTDVLGVAVEETFGVSVLALESVLLVAELGRCTHFFAATAWKAPASAKAANPTVERMVGFVRIDKKQRSIWEVLSLSTATRDQLQKPRRDWR